MIPEKRWEGAANSPILRALSVADDINCAQGLHIWEHDVAIRQRHRYELMTARICVNCCLVESRPGYLPSDEETLTDSSRRYAERELKRHWQEKWVPRFRPLRPNHPLLP